jgi:hypothetical protein
MLFPELSFTDTLLYKVAKVTTQTKVCCYDPGLLQCDTTRLGIVTWMAKALLGNNSVNTLNRTQQHKYECLLLAAGQQAAHQ